MCQSVSEYKKKFYCREWAMQKLSHCLDQRPVSKACGILVIGAPGCGKTTFCAELCWPTQGPAGRQQRSLNRRLLAHHFLVGQDEKTLSVAEFVRCLAAQILNHSTESVRERSARKAGSPMSATNGDQPPSLPNFPVNPRTTIADAYLEKLRSDSEIQSALKAKNIETNPDDCFKRAILFPLLEIEPPKVSLFLLVDSVDERAPGVGRRAKSSRSKSRSIAELLSNHHHLLPQWLLLVCTARKQSRSVSKMFTGFRKLSLDDLRKAHVVRDVQQYILARLDQENALRQLISRDTAEMLNQLHIKSNGCFLYLEKVLDGVADNFIALREIRDIPGTLNGLYLWFCQRLFSRKQFHKVRPLLNLLLATRRPLDEALLLETALMANGRITPDDFRKRFQLLRRVLVVGGNGALRIFHHSFAEWLLDIKHCTQRYLCDIHQGHCALAMYYTKTAPLLGNRDIFEFAFHMVKVEEWMVHQQKQQQQQLQQSKKETSTSAGATSGKSGPKSDEDTDKEPLIGKGMEDSLISDLEEDLEQHQEAEVQTEKEKIEPHTLVLLWTMLSGCALEECLLDSSEDTGLDFDASLPFDVKAHRLLVEAGAVEQEEDSCDFSSRSASPDQNNVFEVEASRCALHAAARLGQAHAVRFLLESGVDANEADSDGWTPLRAAAWAGHADVVRLLVAAGSELDSADAEGRTALRAAAWSGHDDVVGELVQRGATVDKEDSEGRTALIAAAYMGHADIAERLLDAGADVDHSDADGRTALGVAALCAPPAVVALLLDRGAKPDHQDREGMTPLLVAAFEGHLDACELLLDNEADPDLADRAGRSPLWAAASMGHAEVVKLLLFWGCCVDSVDADGRTVLSVASAQGCAEVVRQLLARGLDEQHRDNSGWAPLHYASAEGHVEVVEALLDAGARPDQVDNEGRAPLALAAQSGFLDVVRCLVVDHGADPDQRPHDGRTALRLAALHGHRDVAQLLLDAGAGIDAKDADGRSTLYVLALDNRIGMAKLFISRGADVETRDYEGRTPLHVSAWQGHMEMVSLLLEAGKADVDARDVEQRTALHSASWQGHSAVARLLLEAGATPDASCSQGATPLGVAAQEGHEACVRALLDHGADPRHADSCGRTALRVALKAGHRSVVRLLEEHSTNGTAGEARLCSEWLTAGPGAEPQQSQRRSLGSNSKSSNSNLTTTGSSHSSKNHDIDVNQISFTQQVQQCARTSRTPNRLLSPLHSEPHSPIYASPPLSPTNPVELPDMFSALNIYQPVLGQAQPSAPPAHAAATAATQQDTHFARDTHMRIILSSNNGKDGGKKAAKESNSSSVPSKPKRNGIVTNPAMRLMANVKNGLDSAAANLRKAGVGGGSNPSTRTHSFQWRKETPL